MLQTTPAPCTSCGRAWSDEDFYTGCAECKTCKRTRSRRNRTLDARKILLAERFVDALAELAEQGRLPDDAAPVAHLLHAVRGQVATAEREGAA